MLVFEDNSKKVGVRFDVPVPGGLDLGGSCEEGHGYFCSTMELLLEGSRQDEEAEGAAVTALFELATEVAQKGPVLIHIRVSGWVEGCEWGQLGPGAVIAHTAG